MKTRLLVLLLVFGSACSNGPAPPDNLISRENMVQILSDVHLAEQRVSGLRMNTQDSSLIVFESFEQKILKKYGADTAAYRVSYIYYMAHPDQFKDIYQGVIDTLTARDERARKQQHTGPDSTSRKPQ